MSQKRIMDNYCTMKSFIPKKNKPPRYENEINDYRASNDKIFIALYDYIGQKVDDLTFKKGDQLLLLENSTERWRKGKLLRTMEEGYAPSNFIAPYNCYFGSISRNEAERFLRNSRYGRGTYLIRRSESGNSGFSLSIHKGESSKDSDVMHYQIKSAEKGEYCIADRAKFTNLQELVEHYTTQEDGLVCRLTRPCPRPTTAKLSKQMI